MKNKLSLPVLAGVALIAACERSIPAPTSSEQPSINASRSSSELNEAPKHEHAARGFAGKVRSGANMTWHNGAIMTNSTVKAIYWGTSWSGSDPKIAGLASLYQGIGGSNYSLTTTEFTGTNGRVTGAATYAGSYLDNSPASGGATVAPILAEVCKVVTSPAVDGSGYYAVYTDLPRGSAGYCAWHSYGSCGGVPVQIAFFWKLDGDGGCDPQDVTTGHSQGLAALANVSAHEIAEAWTDPRNGGWYDRQGAENADKCAWTFHVPSVTLTNGTKWKFQGEWSNAAYTAGTGYPNSSGQHGCLDGH